MKNSLWKDAFNRLISNKLSLFGSIYILFIVVLALITPLIAPYEYAYQDLDLGPSAP
jgi:ABC-type dipeptide/oligopeptide/nickel transport systems, permease components